MSPRIQLPSRRRRRRDAAAVRLGARSGMSLIEVIVALLILTGVLLGLGGFTAKFAQASSQAHLVINANEIAARRLDAIRTQATYAALDTLTGSDSTSPNSRADYLQYVVKTLVKQTGGAIGDTIDYKAVTVTVTHKAMKKAVQKTTIMAAF
jgi:prepilin-type N-terminal cleavage/methylation domain-containing protein